jgi:hypothetical protein
MNPFDFVNSINQTKEDLMQDPDNEKKYNSFIINRSLSYFPDTVALANEMNRYHQLDNKMQFDFLRSTVRKRKRFSKWNKPEKQYEVELVKQYYGYNSQKAESIVDLLSREQIQELERVLSKGGRK